MTTNPTSRPSSGWQRSFRRLRRNPVIALCILLVAVGGILANLETLWKYTQLALTALSADRPAETNSVENSNVVNTADETAADNSSDAPESKPRASPPLDSERQRSAIDAPSTQNDVREQHRESAGPTTTAVREPDVEQKPPVYAAPTVPRPSSTPRPNSTISGGFGPGEYTKPCGEPNVPCERPAGSR